MWEQLVNMLQQTSMTPPTGLNPGLIPGQTPMPGAINPGAINTQVRQPAPAVRAPIPGPPAPTTPDSKYGNLPPIFRAFMGMFGEGGMFQGAGGGMQGPVIRGQGPNGINRHGLGGMMEPQKRGSSG